MNPVSGMVSLLVHGQRLLGVFSHGGGVRKVSGVSCKGTNPLPGSPVLMTQSPPNGPTS